MTRPSLSDDASPEAYGEAMVRCLGYPPACSALRACAMDGYCFRKATDGYRQARRVLRALIDAEGHKRPDVRAWFRLALEAIDHSMHMQSDLVDVWKKMESTRRSNAELNAFMAAKHPKTRPHVRHGRVLGKRLWR